MWGRYADEIIQLIDSNSQGPNIIIIQYCRVKLLNGKCVMKFDCF